jgi:sugar (pentulose or hexulose) kinase
MDSRALDVFSMNRLLVGLDVGTSASKAVTFTVDGRPFAEGAVRTPWKGTKLGAEVDARGVVAAPADAVRGGLAQPPDGVVLGPGVTSMGESGVPLDSQGAPRTPIIAGHEGTRA